MRCPTCSSPIPDGAVLCSACGTEPTVVPRGRGSPAVVPVAAPGNEATGMAPLAALERMRDRVAGRYELLEILGQGGMGVVYRARDLQLGEMVAIKVIAPSLTQDPVHVDRLKQEIVTTRKITHPNVIRLHDFGLAGTEPFISMELLEGGTLDKRLAAGLLPVDEAIDIAVGIAEGLAAAHAQGIVHRDVKPQNVIFDASGRPKLVDFGLARLASASRGNTVAGFTGTPYYMSPELFTGGTITPSSDLYSFGVMLFEIFTGRRPFEAKNLLALAEMHCKQPAPSPRTVRQDFPWELETVVARLLEKDPARRYPDVGELVRDLRAFQQGRTPQSAIDALGKRGAPMMSSSRGQETIITRMPPVTPVARDIRPDRETPSTEIPTQDTLPVARGRAAVPAELPTRQGSAGGSRSGRVTGPSQASRPTRATARLPRLPGPAAIVALVAVGIGVAIGGYWWARNGRGPDPSVPVAAGTASTAVSTPRIAVAPTPAHTAPSTVAPTIAVTPAPTPLPVRYGAVHVISSGTTPSSSGPFRTFRSAMLLSEKSPLRDQKLPVGAHELEFRCVATKKVGRATVRIEAGKTTSLTLDCATGTVTARTSGKPPA